MTSRLVGVEWEFNATVEGHRIREVARKLKCKVVPDGSCGWEVVTPPLPSNGHKLGNCIRQLGQQLRHADIDHDCSVHVHVDARDLTKSDMKRLMHVYAHVEPVLYALGGENRLDNDFCNPVSHRFGENGFDVDKWGAIITGSRIYNDKKCGARYYGLNVLPYVVGKRYRRRDTTVEFRMHENTHDPERIINWTRLLADIVSSVKGGFDINRMDKNQFKCLNKLSPRCRKWLKLTKKPRYRNLCMVGGSYKIKDLEDNPFA